MIRIILQFPIQIFLPYTTFIIPIRALEVEAMPTQMNLESLANELLLDIYGYLFSIDLLRAFDGLNCRFDSLLFRYFAVHGFYFLLVYSNDFDTICRKYLPRLADKIPAMCIEAKSGPVGTIDRFSAHGFAFGQFLQLKSLSLKYFIPKSLVNLIMLALPQLINLMHLSLEFCDLTDYGDTNVSNALPLVNCIWSLPKLTHCVFNNSLAYFHTFGRFLMPTETSSSITHLSLFCLDEGCLKLNDLFNKTPNLQHLSTSFTCNSPYRLPSSPILSITSWNISLETKSGRKLIESLRWMPNVCRLKMDLDCHIDGQYLEEMIRNHLPKLKILHFRMRTHLYNDETIEQTFDQLLDTFRSRFWLNERCWFVRFHWNPISGCTCLYTLPYAFDNFYIDHGSLSKSTCPQDKNQLWSYDRVRDLVYKIDSSEYSILGDVQFFSLKEFAIYLPAGDHFWSMVSTFSYLTSIEIQSDGGSGQYENQLQLLLDRTPRRLPILNKSSSGRIALIELKGKNMMINHLDLRQSCLDQEECIRLSHTPIAMQCEELWIVVKDRTSICYLINTMPKLRFLNVECDDVQTENSAKDEFIDWLKKELSNMYPNMKISDWRVAIRIEIR